MEVSEQGQTLDQLAKSGWKEAPPPSEPTSSKGHDFKILGVNIHVPAEEKPRVDSNMIGWGDRGAGIAPEDALIGGQAVKAIAAAGPTIAAKAKTAAELAAPQAKYWLTKGALIKLGVPPLLAEGAAVAVSGWKGTKEPPAPTGPHLDRSVPVRPSELTQQQLAERIKFGTGTPPAAVEKPMLRGGAAPSAPVAPVVASPVPPVTPAAPSAQSVAPPPSGESLPSPRPANSLPDQKALNEAALARRRAEYQATSAARTPAPAAKPTLLASEAKEYLRLIQSGKSAKDAMASIEMQRALNAQLGLGTPSPAETKFPKGMRGGLPK